MIQKLVSSVILFLLALGTGLLLSKIGRPYNTLVFTFHKLIFVATVIVTFIIIRNTLKNINVEMKVFILILITIVVALVLFISGALMSVGVGPYNLLRTLHAVISILAAIMIMIIFYYGKSNN